MSWSPFGRNGNGLDLGLIYSGIYSMYLKVPRSVSPGYDCSYSDDNSCFHNPEVYFRFKACSSLCVTWRLLASDSDSA